MWNLIYSTHFILYPRTYYVPYWISSCLSCLPRFTLKGARKVIVCAAAAQIYLLAEHLSIWPFLAIYPKKYQYETHSHGKTSQAEERSEHIPVWLGCVTYGLGGRLTCFRSNEAVLHFIYVVLGSLQIRHMIIYPADNAEWRFCIEVPTAAERRTTRIKNSKLCQIYKLREKKDNN